MTRMFRLLSTIRRWRSIWMSRRGYLCAEWDGSDASGVCLSPVLRVTRNTKYECHRLSTQTPSHKEKIRPSSPSALLPINPPLHQHFSPSTLLSTSHYRHPHILDSRNKKKCNTPDSQIFRLPRVPGLRSDYLPSLTSKALVTSTPYNLGFHFPYTRSSILQPPSSDPPNNM